MEALYIIFYCLADSTALCVHLLIVIGKIKHWEAPASYSDSFYCEGNVMSLSQVLQNVLLMVRSLPIELYHFDLKMTEYFMSMFSRCR